MTFWERVAFFANHFLPDSVADIPLVIALLMGWRSHKQLTFSGRIVLGLLSSLFLITLVSYVLAFQSINNHFIFTIQALAEFVCLGLFYSVEIKTNVIRRSIFLLMALYALVFMVFFDRSRMNDLLIGLERLLLMGFVLAYFWSLLTAMTVANLLNHPPFWVSVAVLLNGAGTVFIYLFNRMTLVTATRNSYYVWYWSIAQGFLCLFYGLLAYSLWISRRTGSSSPRRVIN